MEYTAEQKTQLFKEKSELLDKRVFIDVRPVDSWENWSFVILQEDCMAPFFELYPEREYKSYFEALDAGIEYYKNY